MSQEDKKKMPALAQNKKKRVKQSRISGFNSVTTKWIPPVKWRYKQSGRVPAKSTQQINIQKFLEKKK
jgi:hypothetical protein